MLYIMLYSTIVILYIYSTILAVSFSFLSRIVQSKKIFKIKENHWFITKSVCGSYHGVLVHENRDHSIK